jgi:hypothetical protein
MPVWFKNAALLFLGLSAQACSPNGQAPTLVAGKRTEDVAAICTSLNDTINKYIVNVAISRDTTGGDMVRLGLIRLNLELLTQNRCPARTAPIDPFSYGQHFPLQCYLARLEMEKSAEGRGPNAAAQEASACDLKRWDPRQP